MSEYSWKQAQEDRGKQLNAYAAAPPAAPPPSAMLTAAADLIRDLAAKTSPGPWAEPDYDDSPGDAGWWIRSGVGMREHAVAVAVPYNASGEADARWIAALSPALADDLSALLVALDGREFDAARVIALRLSARVLGEENHG